ncbi:MAG: GatB/YqeY domain-containing protein [Azospirillaceae bacterium]|nr:GatB/YqeY domain-containing protein [Azospirillaceae bacterium]
MGTLRLRLNESLKDAMRARNARAVSTLRMVLAQIKDRDIAARPQGNADGIDDDSILSLLQSMIKQRRESMVLYEQGGRADLVQQEAEEVTIIEGFLPRQLDDAEAAAAIAAAIAEVGATGVKDMGKVMTALRARLAGQMDFAKASVIVKQQLTAAS